MKIVAIFTIIIGFLAIGCMLADYYKKRNRFFEDLLYLCDLLMGEISFLQHKLTNIVERHISSFSIQFQKLLVKYKEYLNNQISIEDLKNFIADINFVTVEEADDIYNFLSNLGKLDSENELENIKNYKQLFVKFSTSAMQDKIKYVPMFIKLGLIFGCIIAIILL